MTTSAAFTGFYDYRLVILSIVIAIVAAYAALDLAGRVTKARGSRQLAWLCSGATAMGAGIWAMHYIGMEAFILSVPVLYDWPTVLLSLLAAIVASGMALFVVSRRTMGLAPALIGSVLMGGGIASMHYIGMAAMRVPAMCQYDPPLVSLSVALAIMISYLALRLKFAFRKQLASWSLRKFGSAVLMGMAIPVMHYVGMAAVTLVPGDSMDRNLQHAINVSTLGLTGIVLVTLLLLSVAIVTSVIDRQLSQKAQELADGRVQLQSVFDNMTDGIIVLDLERNVVQANQAAKKLLGLRDSTLSSVQAAQNYEVLLPNGEPVSVEDWPGAMAHRGEFLRHRMLLIRRNDTGKELLVEISTTPIRNGAGQTVQIIVTYRDMTELSLNADMRARLAAIVESSEDAIIGKDHQGIVRTWNAAAERIFGYTAAEMIGHSIMQLVPTELETEEREFLSRIKQGIPIEHIETLRKRKDGKLLNVSLTISPIRDSHNNVVGASKMARDITERKQLERQLYQSQKMEAIGQLSGGIAHDFNNLLAVIIGNLSLLERLVPRDESALKRLQTAQKAAWRGSELVRRLLTFSSNEALEPAPTSLKGSIQNTIDLAARAIGPEIEITTDLDELMPMVFVDAAGLESALLNLAVNARDAMPKGGKIVIKTEMQELDQNYPPVKAGDVRPGSYACVSVADTGYGMSQQTLERVFEPFFTTKPRGKGTGLGLAMVYGFAKQSGGVARIYSEIGYGTTVTLYLPLAQGVKPLLYSTEQKPVTRPGSTVLVVDDEEELLDVACTYLREMGYRPLRAANGTDALNVIERSKDIDLVVTDIIMPGGMNGVELVQRIRELLPNIKIIYSSGFSANALEERGDTVVDGLLLHKPYQRATFTEMVRQAVEDEHQLS